MNSYVALFLLLGISTLCHASDKAVNAVLDALHQSASEAKADDYFSLFTPNAVFIGTDVSEVWTLSEFKAYAMPHFDSGNGWTYHPYERHVYFSKNHDTAWFDELLKNEKLGTTRGTGVLVKHGEQWKLAQYHLAIPIPNPLATDVADQIKALTSQEGK